MLVLQCIFQARRRGLYCWLEEGAYRQTVGVPAGVLKVALPEPPSSFDSYFRRTHDEWAESVTDRELARFEIPKRRQVEASAKHPDRG